MFVLAAVAAVLIAGFVAGQFLLVYRVDVETRGLIGVGSALGFVLVGSALVAINGRRR